MRLAGATYPDLRLSTLASELVNRIDAFAEGTSDPDRRAHVVAILRADTQQFQRRAEDLDARADTAVQSGDVQGADRIYAHLRQSESAFVDRDTTEWQRSLLYSVSGSMSGILPSLDATLDPRLGDAALNRLDSAFKDAVEAATL